jgi:hypothetical protein
MVRYQPTLIPIDGKTPVEEVDVEIPFGPWLPGGDTLASLVSCTATAGITVKSSPAPAPVGNSVVFWLAGGSAGVGYVVTVVVTTAAGRRREVHLQILVSDPAP